MCGDILTLEEASRMCQSRNLRYFARVWVANS